MNSLVKIVDVNTLPTELREGIEPGHHVEVTVRDLGLPPRRRTAAELFNELETYAEERGHSDLTLDDAVKRIRELRDEWT